MKKRKYYRNREPINGVEEQSLWKKIRGCFIVVNNDEFKGVAIEGNEDKFYEVEIPKDAEKHL